MVQVVELAETHGVPLRTTLAEEPRRSSVDQKSERIGSAQATVRERNGLLIEELFANAESEPGLWLALDCLQDPHNVGAIFRTASFFGVKGIVMTRDRSAPLTATVYDVAAGGLEYVPFGEPTNLARAMNIAKSSGIWLLGSSEHAELDVREVSRDRSWLLILGNEELGLRRLSLDKCDQVCKLTVRCRAFVERLGRGRCDDGRIDAGNERMICEERFQRASLLGGVGRQWCVLFQSLDSFDEIGGENGLCPGDQRENFGGFAWFHGIQHGHHGFDTSFFHEFDQDF